jgi:uncharacterized protein (TIGR02271 family)
MPKSAEGSHETIPLVEEQVSIAKHTVQTGRVRIRTVVDERETLVREELAREEATVERVPIDREVTEVPKVRQEGDVLVVPVVEEVLVVEKRLVLKEELHIRKKRQVEQVEQPVTVRSTRAVVERERLEGDEMTPKEEVIMASRVITALFDTLADAERARARLIEVGIARDQISIVAQGTGGTTTGTTVTEQSRKEGGFLDALADLFLPEEDRYAYAEGIRRGGHLLTVRAVDANIDRVISILEECRPVDIDQRAQEWRSTGWTGWEASRQGATGAGAERSTEKEEVLPVVEERLNVGKREVERGGVRVRSYVVEQPVQEQVNLREERVTVERRPVDQPVAGDPSRLMQEREIEVTETAERPVVNKEAVVREEVVVGKEAQERTETVQDTVRRTEVEVEDERTKRGPDGTVPKPGAR